MSVDIQVESAIAAVYSKQVCSVANDCEFSTGCEFKSLALVERGTCRCIIPAAHVCHPNNCQFNEHRMRDKLTRRPGRQLERKSARRCVRGAMPDTGRDVVNAIQQLERDLTYHSRLTRHRVDDPGSNAAEAERQLQELEAKLRSCETDVTYAEACLDKKAAGIEEVRALVRIEATEISMVLWCQCSCAQSKPGEARWHANAPAAIYYIVIMVACGIIQSTPLCSSNCFETGANRKTQRSLRLCPAYSSASQALHR